MPQDWLIFLVNLHSSIPDPIGRNKKNKIRKIFMKRTRTDHIMARV
jgi:hypothetical protein